MRAWSTWGISAGIYFLDTFHRVAPGVLALEVIATFGTTRTVLALLSPTYFYAYAAMTLPSGAFVEEPPLKPRANHVPLSHQQVIQNLGQRPLTRLEPPRQLGR